jgi:EmrB/QacA subfamily drug resistance transporter
VTAVAGRSADRARWFALIVLCTGMLMIILDSAIVNVALPWIQRDLGFSQSQLVWVVNSYLITFGGLLLLSGRLGDLLGRRRIFLVGMVIFTLASLACGIASSQTTLIIARFVQGAGGALTSSVILGIIVTMFREPGEQARAIGVFSFVAAGGASLGLLLGGVLTQALNWHWIFFVNVPIGIATFVLARRLVPHEEGIGLDHGADIAGSALVTGALMLGVYTILEAPQHGWGSTRTLTSAVVVVGLLAAFVRREATARTPLVPLEIFRNRRIVGANVIQMLGVAGMFGMFFLAVLYLQRVLGYDALETGFAFLPVSGLIGALSLGASARLTMRYGARRVLIPAMTLMAIGLALFTQAPVDGSYLSNVLPVMVVLGVGAGLFFPALTTLAMSGVELSESGLASGLINTSLQVGGALGLAVLAGLATTRTEHLRAAGDSAKDALIGGYHLAFAVAAGLVVLGIVIAKTVLRDDEVVETVPVENLRAEAVLQEAA